MAVHDFTSQRLFVEHELSNTRAFEASREQANYLISVLRMKQGESILVFNGRDGEWRAIIDIKGRKKCTLQLVEQTKAQPERSQLIYCFAPLKQARLDYMIQKAVEMGAGILQPVITQHTQVRHINEKRILANSIEAAEQCGMLNLPEIREAIAIEKLSDLLGNDTQLVFCDEAANKNNPRAQMKSENNKKVAVLIGPEGGFSNNERSMLDALPNVIKLGLGPRILRADTAAIAALAIIQANMGDWYTD